MLREVKALLYKEFLLEWKQKYAFNGLVLYVLSIVTVVALSFMDKGGKGWNAIYWVIMVFVAINAIAKSFIGERSGNLLYLYTVARPSAIMVSKIIYNSLLLIFVGFVALLFHALLGNTAVQNLSLFSLTLVLGSCALATNLTLVGAIASRAENKTTLMAVLSFPLIVPIHLTLARIGQKAVEGYPIYEVSGQLWFLAGITVVLVAASLVLFPVVWRE